MLKIKNYMTIRRTTTLDQGHILPILLEKKKIAERMYYSKSTA
jgi:hypothetical protein